jgi:copper chaperone CopZ
MQRTYTVEGMTCGHCELSVREEVEELAGVESAEADHATGRLTVHGDADEHAVREAVAIAGYRVAEAA